MHMFRIIYDKPASSYTDIFNTYINSIRFYEISPEAEVVKIKISHLHNYEYTLSLVDNNILDFIF